MRLLRLEIVPSLIVPVIARLKGLASAVLAAATLRVPRLTFWGSIVSTMLSSRFSWLYGADLVF